MKTIREIRTRGLGMLAVAALALGAAACDNPVEQEDHAVGLALVSGTTTVATWTEATGSVGTVPVALGTSSNFQVFAVGEDGGLLDIDGEEYAVSVASTGSGITAALQGADQLVVTGSAAGTSALSIAMSHDGHEELVAEFSVAVQ